MELFRYWSLNALHHWVHTARDIPRGSYDLSWLFIRGSDHSDI